jgi:hypothetical protein
MRLRNFPGTAIVVGSILCTISVAFAADKQMQERHRYQVENRWQAVGDAAQQRGHQKTIRTLGSSDSRPTYYGQGYESRMGVAGHGMSAGRGGRR